MLRDRRADLPLYAAPREMADQDHRPAAAPPAGTPARKVQSPSRLRQRIGQHMSVNQLAIARMQALQQHLVPCPQVPSRRTEGTPPDMRDEHARGRHMAPAAVTRTQAEIVFLAIALSEHIVTEHADVVQAGTLHV